MAAPQTVNDTQRARPSLGWAARSTGELMAGDHGVFCIRTKLLLQESSRLVERESIRPTEKWKTSKPSACLGFESACPADTMSREIESMRTTRRCERETSGSRRFGPWRETDPMPILEKVYVISGGASGLGAATARLLVENGAKVILADINHDAG